MKRLALATENSALAKTIISSGHFHNEHPSEEDLAFAIDASKSLRPAAAAYSLSMEEVMTFSLNLGLSESYLEMAIDSAHRFIEAFKLSAEWNEWMWVSVEQEERGGDVAA